MWPLLERAAEIAPQETRHTSADLKAKCQRAAAQLWIVWDAERQDYAAACVTMLTHSDEFPPHVLDIVLLGGRDMKAWLAPLWTTIRRWGASKGADITVICGRKGWQRVMGLKHIGFTESGLRRMARLTLELKENE